MNPVDAMAFKKKMATREGDKESSENFEMQILVEGALDKALMFTENNRY